MAKITETQGTYLRRLLARSGLTQDQAAQRMGYRRASSIQRYLDQSYEEDAIKIDLAEKFARAFVGLGDPPIRPEEIYSLAGVELTDRGTYRAITYSGMMELGQKEFPASDEAVDADLTFKRSDVFRLPKDLPVYGTALGSSLDFTTEECGAVAVEQTELQMGEVIEYMRRPPTLLGNKEAHILYVQGSSMEPKFEEGDPVLVDPRRPIRARDYVIVTLHGPAGDYLEHSVSRVLVKRLVRRTAEYIELEQFNPSARFRVPAKSVVRIAPVIPWGDAMGF